MAQSKPKNNNTLEDLELPPEGTMDLAPTRKNHRLEVHITRGRAELVPFNKKTDPVIALKTGEYANFYKTHTLVAITNIQFTTEQIRKK